MNDEPYDHLADTGPFCRHWHDPNDCCEVCATCGHLCRLHGYEGDTKCDECECKEWTEMVPIYEELMDAR